MNLQSLIDQFIKYRQSLGEQWLPHCKVRGFGRFVGPDADVAEVTSEQVNSFLAGAGRITLNWHVKLSELRTFYQYAVSRGYVDKAPLPAIVPKRPPAFVPYVYSHDELARLLQAAKSFERPSLGPGTLHVILLLLYATGLRVGELLRLDRADVDLSECLLTVRQSKFGKTRLVPFAPQLQKVLIEHHNRHSASGEGVPFIAMRSGGRLKADTLHHSYRALCAQIGISRADGGRYQPRIHDFRHTFAVHRLTSWYRQGADVQKLLPLLSVYLGHVHIRATQVYLSMTPELLEEAGNRFESYATTKEACRG
jgi:integrase